MTIQPVMPLLSPLAWPLQAWETRILLYCTASPGVVVCHFLLRESFAKALATQKALMPVQLTAATLILSKFTEMHIETPQL